MSLNVPAWQKNPSQNPSLPQGPLGSDSSSRAYQDPVTGTVFPQGPYQESWYLSLRDPSTLRALDLRFSILISSNGFRRLAEAWAVFFQKNPGSEAVKIAMKESFDLKTFSTVMNKEGFQISDCEFSDTQTRGKVQSKGRSIEWDLTMEPRQQAEFDLVPNAIKKTKLIRHMIVTPQPDLAFTGVVRVNGEEFRFNRAPGMQGHQSGPRNAHSWIHGHCNVFTNEQGVPVPFVFEGLTMRSHLLAGIPSPKISSFYFLYQGKEHHFNNIRDAIRLQSRHGLNEWTFQAERGDLLFRGRASVEHKDFAGLTLEDTNGSLIYVANSKFSDLEIHVYNRGKLESALRANQTASVEIASRKKNPYVPILV